MTAFRPAMTELNLKNQTAIFPTSEIDKLLKAIADYYETHTPIANCIYHLTGVNMGYPTGGISNTDKIRTEGYYTAAGKTATINVNDPPVPFLAPKLVFTFDGNNATLYNETFRIFKDKSVPFTLYVTTDWAGNAGMFTWAQIQEMNEDGIDIQCHGQTHTRFTDLTAAELAAELLAVNAAFVANGLESPNHCAYPYGTSGAAVEAVVDNYRLTGVKYYSLPAILQYRNLNKYQIGRYRIDTILDQTTCNAFKAQIDDAVINNGAIITIGHSGWTNVYPYGIKEEYLREIIDYAVSKGVDIISVSELYTLLA